MKATSMLMTLLAANAFLCTAMKCPGSSQLVHASCKTSIKATASCDEVREEVLARVTGQPLTWHDPHNNGTYALISQEDSSLELTRTTANKKYTDKMILTLTADGSACQIDACSESQIFSIADFSTNYCNLRMLYCGSAEGCKPVKHDFATQETDISPSVGASKDPKACLVLAANSSVVFL